uniref:Tyrosine N-monooxygenase n=1 Tax=Setaria italica TaxID=4555 RepID=K4A8I0_SETIT
MLLQETTAADDAMSSSLPAPAMLAATAAAVLFGGLVVMAVLYRRNKAEVVSTKGTGGGKGLPPGPRGLPVLGNMHQMLANKPVYRWLDGLLADAGGGIVRVRLGPVHVVAISCPEMAREVLRGRNDAVFADRPTTFAAESFSVGYRSASISPFGDQWRKMRRVLTAEVLAPGTEHRLRAVREGEADHLVRYVRALCGGGGGGGGVDVRHVARHFCGNVIRRLTLGRRHFATAPPACGTGGPGRDEAEHVDALFATLNYLDAFCVSDYFPALVGLDLDGHERVVRGIMRTLRRLHDPVVEERVEEWRQLRKAGERRDPADFLDVLASLDDAAGRPLLTVDEIKAQTILDAVVGRDRLVAERDVRELSYLKACIREAFRLHPYHPFNPPRVAMADTSVAGYAIPKGSQVILSRVGLGRNPNVWEDPLEFRPERHLLDGGGVSLSEPELRFISFSTGRRGCPGLSLGTLITVMLLGRLLQGFDWSAPPGVGRVELREAATSLVRVEPLVLRATPRLPAHLYEAK